MTQNVFEKIIATAGLTDIEKAEWMASLINTPASTEKAAVHMFQFGHTVQNLVVANMAASTNTAMKMQGDIRHAQEFIKIMQSDILAEREPQLPPGVTRERIVDGFNRASENIAAAEEANRTFKAAWKIIALAGSKIKALSVNTLESEVMLQRAIAEEGQIADTKAMVEDAREMLKNPVFKSIKQTGGMH